MSALIKQHRFNFWLKLLLISLGFSCLSLPLYADHQPNILLLVAEDMSPRLGAYGDGIAQTPSLDALAQSSIQYSQAFTTAGVCAPSRAALITGLHQSSFAAGHMRTTTGPLGPYLAKPPANLKAFPELLREHGYFTYTDRKLDYQFSGVGAGSGPFTIWDRENAADDAWRERQPGQPFFALINFLETHESGVMRTAGEPHSDSHQQTMRMRAAQGLIAPAVTDPRLLELEPYYPDLPEVRSDIARHYDNIAAMDQRVGNILNQLLRDGLFENTIIIFTTDHGDALPRAKRELYDSGIHVPLLVSIPRALRTPFVHSPRVDDRLVSFVDLAPTILAMANVPVPPNLHGQSLFETPRTAIFAARDRLDTVVDRQRAIRTHQFKYIRSWYPDLPGGHPLAYRDNLDMVRAMRKAYREGRLNDAQQRWFEPVGTEQLYDIQSDPYELNNLASNPEYAATLKKLSSALSTFLENISDSHEIPEVQLRESLLVDGQIPTTPPPTLHLEGSQLTARSLAGASIGYRLVGTPHWHLYTAPIDITQFEPNSSLEVKAVRYGWRESVAATQTLN